MCVIHMCDQLNRELYGESYRAKHVDIPHGDGWHSPMCERHAREFSRVDWEEVKSRWQE